VNLSFSTTLTVREGFTHVSDLAGKLHKVFAFVDEVPKVESIPALCTGTAREDTIRVIGKEASNVWDTIRSNHGTATPRFDATEERDDELRGMP
jgi:hypothetical protein